jgi:hypothetical protein
MGKVYLAPKGYDAPDIQDYTKAGNFNKYFEDCEKYVDRLKKVTRESYQDQCPEAGKEIRYPVGDGYARYVIARLRPVELVWLDVGDKWQYEYIHRLTASDIRKELKRSESLKKLFSSSRKG